MDIDDDDEFGDLYTDVLRPLPSSTSALPQTHAPPPKPSPDPLPAPAAAASSDSDDDDRFVLAPRALTLAPALPDDRGDADDDDWLLGRAPAAEEPPPNWAEDDEEQAAQPGAPAAPILEFPEDDEARVLDKKPDATASGSVNPTEIRVLEEEKGEMENLDQEPVIPGLSATPGPFAAMNGSGGLGKASASDDWDSDSEDDLQIVLNDNSHGMLGGERNDAAGMEDDDDEDGEEDLVIVTDEDQHHHHQGLEEQDWGEESLQPVGADGERKEGAEPAKANGVMGGVAGPRIGYSGHGFHPQHHSMYKYIRPGAAPVSGGPPGGPAALPGQIRPPSALGSIAGRGRGEWRPVGGRGISNVQKSFHPGYGLPVWANNSGRAFGSGLDFTLPSHKTVFDIDIESFEEKPWRHPGVDISDFFNFGLDEDNWKEYCKQLEQLRLESTMQSKIRVYESGRSEQDFDPDLPPELAAVAGHHDVASDNLHHGKVDNGPVDLIGQGRGMPSIRAPLPTGRAIQVETGYGERLPSIDTRPPRIRDSDAIIEIELQGSMDDSTVYNGASEQTEKDIGRQQLKAVHEMEVGRRVESEYSEHVPLNFSGRRREMMNRRVLSGSEGDGILPFPSESTPNYHSNSNLQSPASSGGSFGVHAGGRSMQGISHVRNSSTSGERLHGFASSRSTQVKKRDGQQKERLGCNMGGKQTPEPSPSPAGEVAKELSIEQIDGEHDERLALGDSVDIEGEENSDFRISSETLGDDSLPHSSKQKLSSRVEQPTIQDNGGDDDLRTTNSDNSRAKSGSSRDHQKRRESGEEVMQDGHSRRVNDSRRRHEEEERNSRRKDDYGRDSRQEIERSRTGSKGREVMNHSYPHRDWGPNSVLPVRGRNETFEKTREAEGSIWQRREEDIHSRRMKDEDVRREHNAETGLRNRSKARVNDRSDKDDDLRSKKRVEDGDWRGRNREGGPRQRERDDVSVSRRENLDDHQVRRKRDEEHSRRERTDKEDSVHGYRVREDSGRRKRERDEGSEHRRREDTTRIHGKGEDGHSVKHKEEISRQRDREERQRLKLPHDDSLGHREREEGRGGTRNVRTIEDKSLGGNGRNKDDPKNPVSDKDYLHKDRRRHNELSRRTDRAGEENDSQLKGRDDLHAREKQFNSEDRSSRHDRLSTHMDRLSNVSDNQHMYRERPHRESTRKNKDSEGSGQNLQGSNKKKHEDHNTHHSDKVSLIGIGEQECNDSSSTLSKKGRHNVREQADAQPSHSLRKNGDGEAASDDDNLQESRRGRSKLERWTSHKERDYSTLDSSSLREKETEIANADKVLTDDFPKMDVKDGSDPEPKGPDAGQVADRAGEDHDRHLDTVAKLKRRSERFKLPMPGEKDSTTSKKVENEPESNQSEAIAVDAEVKPERPARKRRWTSS